MGIDKRAAVAAAAAVAAGMALGYWSGAAQGVLAGLGGLVSAAVWQVAVCRQGASAARTARLTAAETAFAPRQVTVPGAAVGEGGVARYLRPEAAVVRFWPRPELEELIGWVDAGERVSVRLMTGAGGSGKTRLARQLGERIAELGWRVVVGAGWPGGQRGRCRG